jgi:hypothetical protein
MSQNIQTTAQRPSDKPFLVELWEKDRRPGGYFTPAAAMHLTSSLRASGLLNQLSPDDLKSLVFLLTFLSPEGHCQPYLTQLAEAMRVSTAKAKARMRRLCDVRWKGEPIVIYSKSASGLSAYSLNPCIVTYEHRETPKRPEAAAYVSGSREAVIAYSRKHYARPRAEVERIIARQMGHDIGESDAERKVRIRLENAGLTSEQAKELLATYHLDTIAQQLDWLPFRHAKNPAGYLIAAIEGNYGEPRAVREERIFRELRYGELKAKDVAVDHDRTDFMESQSADDRLETQQPKLEVSTTSGLSENQSIELPLPDQTPRDETLPDETSGHP